MGKPEVLSNEKVEIEDGLIVVPQASVPAIFGSVEAIGAIVEMVRKEVAGHEPDLGTFKGRRAIASLSAKVSKSKVLLDNLGKDLVSDIKQQAKVIDAARKVARDSLDQLRDETRKPLTEWEEEQERIALEEQRKLEEEQKRIAEEQQLMADHEAALQENELITLRKKTAEQQAEIDRQKQAEADRLVKEKAEADRIERERVAVEEEKARLEREKKLQAEREEQIRKDEAAKVKHDIEEKARKDREEQERIDSEARAEQDRLDKIEADRIAAEEKKAQNKQHQAKVNNAAAADIVKAMADDHPGNVTEAKKIAKAIVIAIEKGEISNISINY